MKRIRRLFAVLLCLLIVALVPAGAMAATIEYDLTYHAKAITKGSKVALKIPGVVGTKIKWKSSKASIATVSKTGVVTAKKEGTCKITGKYSGITFTFDVTVLPKKQNVILLNNNDVKVTLRAISSDGITIRVKNKTKDDLNVGFDYVIVGGAYISSYVTDTVPGEFERDVDFSDYCFDGWKKAKLSAKTIAGKITYQLEGQDYQRVKFNTKKFK